MQIRYSNSYLLAKAKQAEQAGQADEAAQLYTELIKNKPVEAFAYNRLMVYYRRKKEYKKEQQLIKTAIAAYVHQAQESQEAWLKKNKLTARTAKALVKSLGLVDKKGSPIVENSQLTAWRKRLEVVRKRLKTSS
jgi:predicted Zn-dependent protease